ncbi:MAG: PAS domain S-box protein [Acidobacteriota bacterium]
MSVETLPDIFLPRPAVAEPSTAEVLQKQLLDLKFALDEHAIVSATDHLGTITYVNDKFCSISQYSREELVGRNHRIINSGYHSRDFMATLWRTISAGQTWHGEIRNLAKDGSYYWVATTIIPVMDARNKPIGYLSLRNDITAFKEGEQALESENARTNRMVEVAQAAQLASQASAARYRELFESTPLPTWLVDPKTLRFIAVSREACVKYGYTQQEFLHLKVSELYPASGVLAFLKRMQTIEENPASIESFKDRHMTRSGEELEVEVTYDFVEWEGAPAQRVLVKDVTARNQMERKLNESQKMEAIGQLAAGIAHELNTPAQYVTDNLRFLKESFGKLGNFTRLGGKLGTALVRDEDTTDILGQLCVVARDMQSEIAYLYAELPLAVEQSIHGLNHMSTIVRAMKDYSHPEKGKMRVDVNRTMVNARDLTRSVWKDVAEMKTELDLANPSVHCIASNMSQVLMNLIVNAAHAIESRTAKGGPAQGTITIRTIAHPEWVQIEVEDTGDGVPEAVRARIFEPFFTTKEPGKGTGQGLALVRSVVVEEHGGRVGFRTECGLGTTFVVVLPVDGAHLSEEGIAAAEAACH